MAASLEVNKMLAALLTAGIIASGTGVISRMIYHPHAPEKNAYPIEVPEATAGGAKEAEAPAQPIAVLLASANAEHGQAVAKACAACHNLGEGQPNKIGPHLYGILGRKIASVPDFSYSSALQAKTGVWDYDHLNEFLSGPKAFAPGTKMTFAGLKKPTDRADVILYLRSLAESPEPLPEAPAAEAAPAGPEKGAPEKAAPEKGANEQAAQEPAQPAPATAQPAEATEEKPEAQPAEPKPAAQPADQTGQQQAEQKPQPAAEQPAEPKSAAAEAAPAAPAGGDFAQLLAAADPAEGERSAKICKACHNFEAGASKKIGPPLHDVVGREIASVPDFTYSSALKDKGGTWGYDQLNDFLTSPKEFAPGTKMTFVGLKKPEQRANVIAYLRSITENPPPLPGKG